MPENQTSVRPLARELIEQCRCDIAAAWEQVEAGRRILDNSRWLLARWAEQARRARAAPQPYEPRLAGTFESVETPRQKIAPRRAKRLCKYVAVAAERLKAEARVR